MKNILLIAAFIFCTDLFSQHRADKWYFGILAGIDFSSGTATAITGGQINSPEGCASIADNTTGDLLFYTDGISVWNKNHVLMPNGTGLLGESSSTQAALIVPQPGSNVNYLVFTTGEIGDTNGLRYSVVDMSLQGGLGDVVSKNTKLLNTVTEKLTAVLDQNTLDYWIMAHDWGNNDFYAYKLSASGLASPVVSSIGTVHSTAMIQNTYGQMKFNGCGTRIACAIGYQDTLEVLDFDVNTGTVSNPVTLPMPEHVYGIEFSPDGEVLYASCYQPAATLFQFDLSSGSQSGIAASQLPISNTPDIYGLQLANDGKIYVVKSFSQYLGVINAPNTVGVGCNYTDTGFDLDPSFNGITASLGTPNFVQSFLNNESGCSTLSLNEPQTDLFQLFPNPSSELIMIKTIDSENFIITLHDLAGHEIRKQSVNKGFCQLNVNDLQNGIYFISVIQHGKSTRKKLVISR